MANESFDVLRPRDFTREFGLPHEVQLKRLPKGDLHGLPLRNNASESYLAVFKVGAGVTLATNLEVEVYLSDDGANALDLGKVVRVGVTVKRLAAGETTDLDTDASAEAAVDVTLDAVSGKLAKGTATLAIDSAADSIEAGDLVAIRVRRIADHANDTCPGTALLVAVAPENSAS